MGAKRSVTQQHVEFDLGQCSSCFVVHERAEAAATLMAMRSRMAVLDME
jgi:hypothetical protein